MRSISVARRQPYHLPIKYRMDPAVPQVETKFLRLRQPSGNDGQWMISDTGGTQPRWRGDGKELDVGYTSLDKRWGVPFSNIGPVSEWRRHTVAVTGRKVCGAS